MEVVGAMDNYNVVRQFSIAVVIRGVVGMLVGGITAQRATAAR